MAQTVTLNGVNYEIPDVGELGWGENVSNYLIALSTGTLSKAGGVFTLQSDVNFGATYGIASRYFKSRSTPASQGLIRLGNTDGIYWRNNTNTADLGLTVNASGDLLWNGAVLAAESVVAAADVTVVPTGNLSANNVQAALVELQGDIDTINTAYPAADAVITAAYQAADSAITTAYQAADTALQGQITTGSTNLTNHIADTSTHGVTGDIVGTSDTQTLTNKTISGSANTFSNIPNSATTATNFNTPGAIVARDGSGGFSASSALITSIETGQIDASAGAVIADTLEAISGLTVETINSYAGISFVTGLVAADAGTDYVFNTGSTRTAGKIFAIQNNGSELGHMDFDGSMAFVSNAVAASGKAGFSFSVPTLQTDVAARPFVVKYVGSDFIYLDRDGTFYTGGSIISGASVTASQLYAKSNVTLGVQGAVNSSAAAIAVELTNQINLTTAGAKLVSVKNLTTEKLAIDKDGNLLFQNNAASIVYSSGQFTVNAPIDNSNGLNGTITSDCVIGYGDGGGSAGLFYADVTIDGTLYLTNRQLSGCSAFVGTSTIPFLFTSNLGASSTTPDVTINTAINRTATNGKLLSLRNFSVEKLAITKDGGHKLGTLGSSIGTPGNATLNTVAGYSKFAAGASTLTITNSLVGTTSIVVAVMAQSDATLTHVFTVIPAAGSFVIAANAAATGTPTVHWYVLNVA